MITALRLRMIAISIVALTMIAVPVWSLLVPHNPIDNLRVLDGCYEGEGLPDFMRPPRHWSMRIADGSLFDRQGNEISKLRLTGKLNDGTAVAFSPPILVAGKPATVMAGDTGSGKAYVSGGRSTIVLADELGQVLLRTTCS